jgi:sn-glycerol 3-phosphate transport system substrate-binding protein
MQRKTFNRLMLATAAAATMGLGSAQAQTAEVSFFYPVAVGGPIAKIIDGMAADFMKAKSPASRSRRSMPAATRTPSSRR